MARTGEAAATKAQTTYQDEANQTFGAEQGDISQFGTNIANLAAGKQVGANPYQNPTYLANEAQLQAGALNGENAAADTALKQANRRSGGLNTGSTQGNISGLALQKMRLADSLTAGRATQDYGKNIAFQQFLSQAPLSAAGAEQGAFGTATSGQSSALGDLTQEDIAAMQAQYGLADAAISGAGAAACPAEGSLYLMADGSERSVEQLRIGDSIAGEDGKPQTVEEIEAVLLPVLRVVTENGTMPRNSESHCFMLADRGDTMALHSMGKIIKTSRGPSKVIEVARDGLALVFNIRTNGSHTYCADGAWAVGVMDAESEREYELAVVGGSNG